MITQAELKEMLDYDPSTGAFVWMTSHARKSENPSLAGYIHRKDGYRYIRIVGRSYAAHRLAHLYMRGVWPTAQVDHINLLRDDNRWCNLRLATCSQNHGNQRRYRNNTVGLKGVSWREDVHRWKAKGMVRGQTKYLGYFDCPAAAHLAYVVWADTSFGEYARAN